jgi:hypothetical protein
MLGASRLLSRHTQKKTFVEEEPEQENKFANLELMVYIKNSWGYD